MDVDWRRSTVGHEKSGGVRERRLETTFVLVKSISTVIETLSSIWVRDSSALIEWDGE